METRARIKKRAELIAASRSAHLERAPSHQLVARHPLPVRVHDGRSSVRQKTQALGPHQSKTPQRRARPPYLIHHSRKHIRRNLSAGTFTSTSSRLSRPTWLQRAKTQRGDRRHHATRNPNQKSTRVLRQYPPVRLLTSVSEATRNHSQAKDARKKSKSELKTKQSKGEVTKKPAADGDEQQERPSEEAQTARAAKPQVDAHQPTVQTEGTWFLALFYPDKTDQRSRFHGRLRRHHYHRTPSAQ